MNYKCSLESCKYICERIKRPINSGLLYGVYYDLIKDESTCITNYYLKQESLSIGEAVNLLANNKLTRKEINKVIEEADEHKRTFRSLRGYLRTPNIFKAKNLCGRIRIYK